MDDGKVTPFRRTRKVPQPANRPPVPNGEPHAPQKGRSVVRVLGGPGSLPALFARGLLLGLVRPQGVLRRGGTTTVGAELPDVVPHPDHVGRYRQVCGLPGSDAVLPVTFPETLFLPVLGAIVTAPEFPLGPLGLIHVRQEITVREPIATGPTLHLSARTDPPRPVERGWEIAVRLEVRLGKRTAWEGVTTLLSRAPAARVDARRHWAAWNPDPRPEDARVALQPFDVPGDTGRAYARASGDWNPHHLWPWTARPLGFRRPIAHGMWTLARALGMLPDLSCREGPVRLDVRFLRPLPMPGRAVLVTFPPDPDGALRFEVRDASSPAVHLVAVATAPDR